MLTTTQDYDQIVTRARLLPTEYRLRLIQEIIKTLLEATTEAPTEAKRGLVYGKYRGKKMSTLEDFKIAEYRPDYEVSDGT